MGSKWIQVIILSIFVNEVAASVGVNYGNIAHNLPSPSKVVDLVQRYKIGKIKLYDANPDVLEAFAGTDILLSVMVPNQLLQQMATEQGAAENWVKSNVLPYLPHTRIKTILVGNEILTKSTEFSSFLLPAMQNIYISLQDLQLNNRIRVSTPHAFDVLEEGSSFPPSAGTFKASLQTIMQPLLDFLSQTDSAFMIDVYPFFAYRDNTQNIPLEYALFVSNASGFTDPNTNLHYTNLFDAQLDAVYAAMKRMNQAELKLVVSETGWPSAGDPSETGASMENAELYNNNLVRHVQTKYGTPMKPGIEIDAYIFELFNEDSKDGSASERHFGLFYPNMSMVGDNELHLLLNASKFPSLPPFLLYLVTFCLLLPNLIPFM